MDRLVEVRTERLQVETTSSAELSPSSAVALFRDIARQLGFVVSGPIQGPRTVEVVYSARASGRRSEDRTRIVIIIHDKRILFVARIYGSREDFSATQRASELYKQALDKQHIHYKVSIRKSMFIPP